MFEQEGVLSIETERCVLRRLEVSDAESIFSYARNPNVTKYTMWEPHGSIADSLNYITGYAVDHYEKNEVEPLGIVLKEGSSAVVGTVGCRWASEKSKTMELMYALDESHWGKGITPEACRAVIQYCFQNLDVNRIQAHYKRPNLNSARVMEKLGMTFEGIQRERVLHRGVFWDMGCYSILKAEMDKV